VIAVTLPAARAGRAVHGRRRPRGERADRRRAAYARQPPLDRGAHQCTPALEAELRIHEAQGRTVAMLAGQAQAMVILRAGARGLGAVETVEQAWQVRGGNRRP
jgi:hypothetical protein